MINPSSFFHTYCLVRSRRGGGDWRGGIILFSVENQVFSRPKTNTQVKIKVGYLKRATARGGGGGGGFYSGPLPR